MVRCNQVECILFRRKARIIEYLLLRRTPEKGAFWQPPCGGVEPTDASILAAAYREVHEETGIEKDDIIRTIPDVHHFVIDRHYLTDEPIPPIEEQVFGFEVLVNVTVECDKNPSPEHDAYVWAPYEEAMALLKWQNNKDAFKKLEELLRQRK